MKQQSDFFIGGSPSPLNGLLLIPECLCIDCDNIGEMCRANFCNLETSTGDILRDLFTNWFEYLNIFWRVLTCSAEVIIDHGHAPSWPKNKMKLAKFYEHDKSSWISTYHTSNTFYNITLESFALIIGQKSMFNNIVRVIRNLSWIQETGLERKPGFVETVWEQNHWC